MKKHGIKYLRSMKRALASKKAKSKRILKKQYISNGPRQKTRAYSSSITQTDETSFMRNIQSEINDMHAPIKIKLSSQFQFTYPQEIVVRVSKKEQENQQHEIDYKQNSSDSLYVQVKAQQFLTNKSNVPTDSRQSKYFYSVPQMTLNQKNYQLPRIVKEYFDRTAKGVYAVNLWHYKDQTFTKWHYDAHDNFLLQLKGTKCIQLLPPNSPFSIKQEQEQDKLCQNSIKQQDQKKAKGPINSSKLIPCIPCDSVFSIDNNHVDESRISADEIESDPRLQVTQINENQCLFIPKGWFHCVKSFLSSSGDNLAVNFWGNTVPTHYLPPDQLETNLKQLIYKISEQICACNYDYWPDLTEDDKQKFRQAHFFQYLSKLTTH